MRHCSGVDALTGKKWDSGDGLARVPQNYVVPRTALLCLFALSTPFVFSQTIPEQPWLDGINCGDGFIRQFIAMRKWTFRLPYKYLNDVNVHSAWKGIHRRIAGCFCALR